MVVAGARPAEFGNHDALAGMPGAQLVVGEDRPLDDLVDGRSFPVGEDVGGDEVDRRGELGRLFRLLCRLFRLLGIGEAEPDVVGLAGRHRHRALALDPLDDSDELIDRLVRTQRGLVADHDRVDVAVAARERDGGLDFPLVAGFVLVDPDAERDLEPELRGDRRHELDAAGGAVGADGVGVGTEDFQVGANLLRRRAITVVRMLRSRVGRIGDAGERRIDVGDRMLPIEQSP
jgi:hypothetical protein